jgi:hypothetical protein
MNGNVASYAPIKVSEQINITVYDKSDAACSGTKPCEQAAADLQDNVSTFLKRPGYNPG